MLPDKLKYLNEHGKINDLLSLLGIDEYTGDNRKEKIAVLGQASISSNELYKVAADMGIPKDRIEMCLEYKKAAAFNAEKLKNDKYAAILVGPMPHSGEFKGKYSSIVTAMENSVGFPPVIRVGTNGMKITKSSFKKALRQALCYTDAA